MLRNAMCSAQKRSRKCGLVLEQRNLNALADQIDITKSIDAGNNLVAFKKDHKNH
jgi:hypothetical protein